MQPEAGLAVAVDGDNDFDDFEEDEMTKRIREEEERIQNRLREKSVSNVGISSSSMRKNKSAKSKAVRITNSSWPRKSRRKENGRKTISGRKKWVSKNMLNLMKKQDGGR